jgi:hypothetical protein
MLPTKLRDPLGLCKRKNPGVASLVSRDVKDGVPPPGSSSEVMKTLGD